MKHLIMTLIVLSTAACATPRKAIDSPSVRPGENMGDYLMRLQEENRNLRLSNEHYRAEAKKNQALYERIDLLEQINEWLRKNCHEKK